MIIQCVIYGARLLEKTEGQLTCQNPKCSEHFKRHLVYDKGMENSFQVTIPHHHSEMTEPGEDRIERYQQHLKVIIDQGILDYSRLEPDNTEVIDDDPAIETDGFLTDAFIELCTLCKGSCCSGAADHAHLKAQTISNLIMQQQDGALTRQQIFDLYLEKIPELSITNSCINHTNKGCALPSDLRSAVCNSYFCQGCNQ
ncbi:hypothetical protein [Pelagibaculum spongiae]|uniref:Uncharacterized protein n=1 Tax=Pelagibaculum spongiae TaxID=2080658 RepID=A0A2V1GTE6_9GAMM|nr:hypothetical protein [Pelagibaculum spongiae]PVZ68945.1 hypothetical protein DC094_11915 [Pelagibaculum spongiae]